jgi:hypothetical protein
MDYGGLFYIFLGLLIWGNVFLNYHNNDGEFFVSSRRWAEWNSKSDGISYYFSFIFGGLFGLISICLGFWILFY